MEDVTFGVKADISGLKDAQVELRVGKLACEIAKFGEGMWIGDVEVIAGQKANPAIAAKEVLKVGSDQAQPAELDERDTQVNGGGPIQMRQQVGQERVVGSPNERTFVRNVTQELSTRSSGAQIIGFPRDDVAYATSRVANIAVISGDEVNVQVKKRLAGGHANI